MREITRRYKVDGFGASIYTTDPEGNVIELKGPAGLLTVQEDTGI